MMIDDEQKCHRWMHQIKNPDGDLTDPLNIAWVQVQSGASKKKPSTGENPLLAGRGVQKNTTVENVDASLENHPKDSLEASTRAKKG